MWRKGVKVTVVCPGYVRTNISFKAITGSGGEHGVLDRGQKYGISAERCAQAIWSAVARNQEEILVGREAVFVKLKQYVPGLFSAVLKRVAKS